MFHSYTRTYTRVSSKIDLLSQQVRAEIDRWIGKYPPDWQQSAVMAALRVVQDENSGWLTTELMDAVAEYLDMPAISVYEVATFYSMYEFDSVGRHKVSVCTNISCALRGADRIVKHLNDRLGVGLGETTPDSRFTLKEVECLGACGGAPVLQIGRDYYENLTPEKVDEILDGLD